MATSKEVQLNVGDLLSHPLNAKLYGEREADKTLQASIEKHGVLEPVTVLTMPAFDGKGQRTYVLSGHRRVLAAKKAQLKKIPARYADIDPKDNLAVEEFIIEANRQRVKTEEQRGRECLELLRIEGIRARERQARSAGGKGKRLLGEKFPEAIKGRARDKAAESLGMSGRTAQKLLNVIEAADAGNEKARAALDAVNDRKKSIDKAFKEIRVQ